MPLPQQAEGSPQGFRDVTDVGACRAGKRRRALTAGCRDPETRLLYVLQGWDKQEGTDCRLQGSRESTLQTPVLYPCRAGMPRRPLTAAVQALFILNGRYMEEVEELRQARAAHTNRQAIAFPIGEFLAPP